MIHLIEEDKEDSIGEEEVLEVHQMIEILFEEHKEHRLEEMI